MTRKSANPLHITAADLSGLELGSRIIVRGTLRRTGDYVPNGRNRAYWVPVGWPEEREGLFIGWRYLTDGEVEGPCSYDEGAIYHPKERFKVALVVFNARQNPLYVPLGLIVARRRE